MAITKSAFNTNNLSSTAKSATTNKSQTSQNDTIEENSKDEDQSRVTFETVETENGEVTFRYRDGEVISKVIKLDDGTQQLYEYGDGETTVTTYNADGTTSSITLKDGEAYTDANGNVFYITDGYAKYGELKSVNYEEIDSNFIKKNGITSRTVENSEGTKWEYTYNEDGSTSNVTIYDADGNGFQIIKGYAYTIKEGDYYYNYYISSNGKICKENNNEFSPTIAEENGITTRVVTSENGNEWTYKYNEDGSTKCVILDNNGQKETIIPSQVKLIGDSYYYIGIDESLTKTSKSEFNSALNGENILISDYKTKINGTVYYTYINPETNEIGYISRKDAKNAGYINGTLDSVTHFVQGEYENVKFECGKNVAKSGCGFCAMASIIGYFTDNADYSPEDAVADYDHNGNMTSEGMSWALPEEVAGDLEEYGVNMTQTSKMSDVIEALKNGAIVANSQGKGKFTSSGHIMVLDGITYDSNGNIMIIVDDSLQSKPKAYYPSEIDESSLTYWIYSD